MNAPSDSVPAEKGSHHWWLQRATALVLVPLTLWFVPTMLNHIGDAHFAARAWVAQPAVALALIAYLAAAFFHAQLGMQVIIEDYVSAPRAQRNAQRATNTLLTVVAAIAVWSIVRIML